MKSIEELCISPWPWKFTFGGWCFDEIEGIEDAKGSPIVVSDFGSVNDTEDDANEGLSNIPDAYLILAAPEMAKVCHDLIMWDGNLDAKFMKIIDDAKAAYAKACGEEAK